jgi:hypothetical protein
VAPSLAPHLYVSIGELEGNMLGTKEKNEKKSSPSPPPPPQNLKGKKIKAL